jgi:iron-sulfur cluster assembly protein
MITLTAQAAKQIRISAQQGQTEGLPLRIAATQKPDKSLHYGMGFDDTGGDENDLKFNSEGIELVVSGSSLPLVNGMVIDYVELEPDQHRFIFLNPNDPNYTPPPNPSEDKDTTSNP